MLEKLQVVVGGARIPVLTNMADGTGDIVCFVHGNPGAGSDWGPLLEKTAEFARVIAPDMPGFGDSERRADQDFTVDSQAAVLDGVLEHLDAARVHLVLHDFGGPWGLTWAAGNPEKVASVTIIDTGINREARWNGFAKLWRTPVIGELVQLMMTRRVNRSIIGKKNPELPEKWLNEIVNHAAPRSTKRAVLKMYRSLELPELEARLTGKLRNLDVPALVVWGGADPFISVDLAQQQLKSFPGAKVEIVPGTGHWPWLDDPQSVEKVVIPFLLGNFTEVDSVTLGNS
ncbi:hypothetical protein B2J88_47420 [Rhodococcus sp. SRB_17]|nr:hypothetical protein [Rhodococcus sp. SRB_17]